MTKIPTSWLTSLTAVMTAFLLVAGALVTGTGSGLAVPDWPLSFGQFFPKMEGGVFFEHGHRMVAGVVLILTTVQTIVLYRRDTPEWIRKTAAVSLGLVLFQALLGGMTVLYRLPTAVSISHACMAQTFFCLTVVIAYATGPIWEKGIVKDLAIPKEATSLRSFSIALAALFALQLLLGATMRHMGAGLAIPDFPTAFGGLVPPYFTPRILVHYLHRLGAFTLMGVTGILVVKIYRHYYQHLFLVGLAGLLVSLLSFQFMLGAMVVWLRRPVPMTTAHLVIGAFCLATSVVLAMTCARQVQSRVSDSKTPSQLNTQPVWEPA